MRNHTRSTTHKTRNENRKAFSKSLLFLSFPIFEKRQTKKDRRQTFVGCMDTAYVGKLLFFCFLPFLLLHKSTYVYQRTNERTITETKVDFLHLDYTCLQHSFYLRREKQTTSLSIYFVFKTEDKERIDLFPLFLLRVSLY